MSEGKNDLNQSICHAGGNQNVMSWMKGKIKRRPQLNVRKYFDSLAAEYASWYRPDTPRSHLLLERKALILECVGTGPGVVLDIGCGPGVMSCDLAGVASRYIGIDYSTGMVQ